MSSRYVKDKHILSKIDKLPIKTHECSQFLSFIGFRRLGQFFTQSLTNIKLVETSMMFDNRKNIINITIEVVIMN